jgi:hypothetical protein
MSRRLTLLIAAFAALLFVISPASAQSPAPGGGKSDQQRLTKMTELLDKVHKKPKAKDNIYAHIKEKMEQHHGQNLPQRLTTVNQILTQAATLSDPAYQQQRAQLAQNLVAAVHPANSAKQGGGKSGGHKNGKNKG